MVAVARRSVALTVLRSESPPRELPFRLEVAAPLPKGDRAAFLVEKLTELGVTAFTPLETARAAVHPREAKLDRLRRHVVEVRPLTPWADFLRRGDLPARRVLAHPGGRDVAPGGPADVAAAVGPEGGFTDGEVALALGAGWRAAGLGPRLLRVETAAVALAVLCGACGGGVSTAT